MQYCFFWIEDTAFSPGFCITAVLLPIVLYVLSVVLSRGLAPQLFRFGFVGGPVGQPSCVLLCRLVVVLWPSCHAELVSASVRGGT